MKKQKIGLLVLAAIGACFVIVAITVTMLSWRGILTTVSSCRTVFSNLHSDDLRLKQMSQADVNVILRERLQAGSAATVDSTAYTQALGELKVMCDEHPELNILQLGYRFLGIEADHY